jgi:hypothetical protein
MIDAIGQMFDLISQHAEAMGGKLIEPGLGLLGALAGIHLCWTIFKKMLAGEGFESVLAEVFMLTLTAGIVAWLIRDIAIVTTAISQGFDWIAVQLTGTGDSKNMLNTIFASFSKISSRIWDGMTASVDRDWWQAIKDTLAGMGSFWLKIFILLVYMIVTVITIAIFIRSQVQVLLAVALLPMFLPFYLLPITQKYADGMTDFFVKSAAMKMVAVLMMSLCIRLMEGSNALVFSVQTDRMALDLVGMIVLLLIAVLTLLFMLQVPSITNAMFSGQTVGLSGILPRGGRPTSMLPSPSLRPPGGGAGRPPIPKP